MTSVTTNTHIHDAHIHPNSEPTSKKWWKIFAVITLPFLGPVAMLRRVLWSYNKHSLRSSSLSQQFYLIETNEKKQHKNWETTQKVCKVCMFFFFVSIRSHGSVIVEFVFISNTVASSVYICICTYW